jgi:hypothetical protein
MDQEVIALSSIVSAEVKLLEADAWAAMHGCFARMAGDGVAAIRRWGRSGRRVIHLVPLVGCALSCSRAPEAIPIPRCVPPAGEFARTLGLAAMPDPELAKSDSGRLVVLVARADTAQSKMDAMADGIALPARDKLVFQRPEPTVFLTTTPAGSVVILVGALDYEGHFDTLRVRAGFADTARYWLKPTCGHLENVRLTRSGQQPNKH